MSDKVFSKYRIKINPDINVRDKIKKDIKDNNGYCPCSFTSNDDTKCICKSFRLKEEEGYCTCGLYYKELINK